MSYKLKVQLNFIENERTLFSFSIESAWKISDSLKLRRVVFDDHCGVLEKEKKSEE